MKTKTRLDEATVFGMVLYGTEAWTMTVPNKVMEAAHHTC